MTAVLESPNLVGRRPGGSAALHAFLDGIDLDLEGLGAAGFAAEVAGWERAVRRVEALKLRVLAQAQTAEVAKATGMSGTDAWLARATKSGRRDAAGQVRLAAALDDGLEVTATALGQGMLSTAHAGVIADATSKLPARVTRDERRVIEAALVDKAAVMNPGDLRRAARRCLEAIAADEVAVNAHENNLLVDEEAAAVARSELSMWDNSDGTVSGRFTVPHFAGAVLRKTIESMTSPRRAALGAAKAHSGPVGFDRDAMAHRSGLAFVELLEHLPTDRLNSKVAGTVVVTIEQSHLDNLLAAAGLDTGERLSAGEARRIACNAGILPAVLGGKSVPLDLGRTHRLFTENQQIALGLEHKTCIADGCERPFAWCEMHHLDPWALGGRTDLAKGAPLCGFHHRRIHDRCYIHRREPNGSITFHRRT
jgi:Domain of unknown function (DUF222)